MVVRSVARSLAVEKRVLAKRKYDLLGCKLPLRERKKASGHGGFRSTQVARAGAPERGAIHGRPGHRDRERRVALDQGRPRVLAGEPAVGDQRVRARLRRLSAPWREGGRP